MMKYIKCIATTKLWDDITGIASIFYTIFQRNENHRKPNQWRRLIKCLARLIKIDAFVPFSLNERIFKGIYYSWMHDHGAIEMHCKQYNTSIDYFILSLFYARILKTVQILLSCKKLIEALIILFQEEKNQIMKHGQF